MSCLKSISFFVTLIVIIEIAISQDCKTPGRYCLNHEDCCGGCCRNRACINTYDLCTINEDPCLEHSCPPGFECHIFQPDCIGCEAVPYCS